MYVNFLVFGKNDGRYETIDGINRIDLVFFVGRRVEPLIELTAGRSVQSKGSVADTERQKNGRKYRFFAIIQTLVEAFPDGIRARTFALFQRMEIVGSYLPNEITKAMGDGLFELRAKAKEGIGRTFYCTQIGKKILVLHAFVKKTQKTPQKELGIARSRMKELNNESN